MSIEFPDQLLSQMWDDKEVWAKNEVALADLQRQLSLAAYSRDDKRILELQKKIVRSTEAKMLAVRHVCSSTAGPGIDGVKWLTSAEKMRGALSLTSKGYHAKPLRMVIIHSKSTGKERRIGVPTYYDRAMQTLYDFSFAPVSEAWAERKSFAFRSGRSLQDVNAYILESLKGNNAPEYVVIADVTACYASIQHKWLLENVPMDKRVLQEFLKAGHVFAGELFPAEEVGISLGANLSPRLGNFALDGIQKYIFAHLYPDCEPDYQNGNLIRFCDDCFINVRTVDDGMRVIEILKSFMEERGLSLSRTKTRIYDIKDGITFLSRTYIKKDGLVHVYPSDRAVDGFIGELREFILSHKKSQRNLIASLNSRLRGWASYHRFSDAYDAFRKVDAAVQTFLLEAATAKHPKQPQKKIIHKYWYETASGKHVYALPDQKEIFVISLADTMLVNHRKVSTNKNPYLDDGYFEDREQNTNIKNVTGNFRAVWERQDGRCYYCGRPILQDQDRTVIQPDLSKKISYRNAAYVHAICKPYELSTRYISDDVTALNDFEVIQLLTDLEQEATGKGRQKQKREIDETWKHIRLKNFFASQSAASITLSFKEIEEIDGVELPPSASKRTSFWYPRRDWNTLAEAWITEGYILFKLNLEKKRITFHRERDGVSHIKVPAWLNEKIPDNARFELEKYFEYIKKKYGL